MNRTYTFHPSSGRIVHDSFPFRLRHRRLHRAERRALVEAQSGVSRRGLLAASAVSWILLAFLLTVWAQLADHRVGAPASRAWRFSMPATPALQSSAPAPFGASLDRVPDA